MEKKYLQRGPQMIGLAYTMQVIKYSMDIFEQAKPQFQKINYINQTLKESNSLGNNCLIYLIYLFIRTFNDWATIPYALKRPLLRMILKSHLKRFFKTSLQLHVYILMEFFFTVASSLLIFYLWIFSSSHAHFSMTWLIASHSTLAHSAVAKNA